MVPLTVILILQPPFCDVEHHLHITTQVEATYLVHAVLRYQMESLSGAGDYDVLNGKSFKHWLS